MMAKSTWAAILVLAGERPLGWARQQLVELAGQSPRPYIIAADGGAAYLAESDIQPDLIIGDSDSIPEGLSPMFLGKRCLLPKILLMAKLLLPICSSTVVKGG